MEQNPVAPPTKTRLMLSGIVLFVGLIMLAMMEEKSLAWTVTIVGALSVVYNVVMMKKGK
ncbi:MAG TPA: hypothetical protein PK295_01075 [Candidatus Magasanikbacteria bacterium]|nr:hypothetical protein [Candidatus Magasanikbacteria bacterium]